jgi:hypothetical protein
MRALRAFPDSIVKQRRHFFPLSPPGPRLRAPWCKLAGEGVRAKRGRVRGRERQRAARPQPLTRLSRAKCDFATFSRKGRGEVRHQFSFHALRRNRYGSLAANQGKRNAGRRSISRPARKRRAVRTNERAACAALRLRARSPAGVPPRLSPEGLSSQRLSPGQASWVTASTGRASRRRRRTHLQRSTSRAGRNAGRHDARTARECG